MSTARVWRPTPAGGRITIAVPYAKGTRLWLRGVCGTMRPPGADRGPSPRQPLTGERP